MTQRSPVDYIFVLRHSNLFTLDKALAHISYKIAKTPIFFNANSVHLVFHGQIRTGRINKHRENGG